MKCSSSDVDEVQQGRGSAVGQRKISSAQARQSRNRRARATLRDKGGGSLCQGQGGVAEVSPS